MRHVAVVIIAASLAVSAAPASAQNTRSFVSGHGLDTNSCALAAPCRTFQRAHDMTNASGEIDVLDPAGYGALTITKAISIVNDGVGTASILVPSVGTGIIINVGASEAVSLRGITIEGAGVGGNGIEFNTGASLTVANCVIRHVTNRGISFIPNAISNLSVSNTVVSDNGASGFVLNPIAAGVATAVLSHVEANNNVSTGISAFGIDSTGTNNVTVSDSVFSSNATGVELISSSGKAPTTVTVFRSVIANNTSTGIFVTGSLTKVLLAQTVVTGNANGWGGNVQSYQDNYIDGNTANQSAPTTIAKK